MLAGKMLGLLQIVLTFLQAISATSFLSLSVKRLFSVVFPLWHRKERKPWRDKRYYCSIVDSHKLGMRIENKQSNS